MSGDAAAAAPCAACGAAVLPQYERRHVRSFRCAARQASHAAKARGLARCDGPAVCAMLRAAKIPVEPVRDTARAQARPNLARAWAPRWAVRLARCAMPLDARRRWLREALACPELAAGLAALSAEGFKQWMVDVGTPRALVFPPPVELLPLRVLAPGPDATPATNLVGDALVR